MWYLALQQLKAFYLHYHNVFGYQTWHGDDYHEGLPQAGVVTCTCNPATLEAEFRNGVGSIPVGGNSPSIGGWIVWSPVIQH